MSYVIEIQKLRQEFSGKCVLDGIDLKVKKGEILGLLGPSGAGKTTLVKILTGQLAQTMGHAILLGEDTCSLSPKTYLKIGTMMDNSGLYDRLTVYDNLKFYARIYRTSETKIDDMLQAVGLEKAKKMVVSKLSKGMRSRLSLVRAVMNEAQVLFLDEPTSGLDPATTREIHKMLLEQREKGTTIFLTTHNMSEAESICDNVALLHQGNLVEYGKPQELCKKYNHLNKLQIQRKDGSKIELENSSAAAEDVKRFLEQDLIATIHSTEPDLEQVFIELTGRGLD